MCRRNLASPVRKFRSSYAATKGRPRLCPRHSTSGRNSRTHTHGAYMYPNDYRYTKEHEWVRLEGGTATIGITDYAQHALGDVVYVELPKVGAKVTAGKSFGTVESVKAVSEIYAPVSGEVIEINASLAG